MSLDIEIVVAALPAYDVGEELGRGAFGIVLAGTHTTLRRAVAIKQLPRAFGADPDVRKRFLSEAQLLASMDHPHVVPIFDFVERDGVCLLVMERLAGGTVLTRMKAGDLDDRFAVATALAAAAGLEHAHRRGVLHRDIKPENLMFSADGVLKVTDFGIAKVVGQDSSMATRAGYALGTPAYMAPEQAKGLDLTAAADVYALGTVLYETLAGRLPYPETSDPVAALYQHVHEDPAPLGEIAPQVPAPIRAVIDRSLARGLDQRYSTAAAFRDALAAAATTAWGAAWTDAPGLPLREMTAMPTPSGGTPSVASPDAAAPRGPRWPSSSRARIAVAVLAVALLGAAGLILAHRGGSGGSGGSGGGAGSANGPSGVGAFTLTPASGPIGTPITLRSTTVCPAPPTGDDGPTTVYIEMFDPRQVTPTFDGSQISHTYTVAADRSWVGEFGVPGTATAGPVHVHVACFSHDPAYKDPGPYYDYPLDQTFTVTPSPPTVPSTTSGQ